MPEAFKGRGLTRLAMDQFKEARLDFIEAVRLRPGWKDDLEKELQRVSYRSPGMKTTLSTAAEKPLSEADACFNRGSMMLKRGFPEPHGQGRIDHGAQLDPKKYKEKVDALIGPEDGGATSTEPPKPAKPRTFPGRRPRE